MIFESRSQENLAPKLPSQKVTSTLTEIISLWAALEKIENDFGVKTQRDFVRSTKQLVDLLNQIGGASEKLRPVCKDAVKRIDRGVVAYLMGDI
jgi:ATP-dependent RNA helicase HelY